MTFVLANLSCRRWPSRAVSSPGRASASDAAAGAAGPLARRRTRSGERPRRRNLRRVPPQSTGLSFPLSVLTKRLPPGIIFYRDSFGGVMSDLRSPRSFGRPAGALVVRTYAGDRKVEIYDMFHTPGTYMPPTGCVAMTHDLQYFSFRRKAETSTYERDEFFRQTTTRAAYSNGNVEAGCMAP